MREGFEGEMTEKNIEVLFHSNLFIYLFIFYFILLGIRVKKAQAPYIFVCVPVFVHLQNETLCQPRPSGLVNTMNLPAFFG